MNNTTQAPGVMKRLLAALYDSLLVLATVFIASALTLPFTTGDASSNNIYITLYLLIVIFIFFGWFWTHGGQTLGMRAWKIRVVQENQQAINWSQALIRFLTGLPSWSIFLFGLISLMVPDKIELVSWTKQFPEWLIALLGLGWVCLDNRSSNWRDKISKTYIIFTEQKKTEKN